MTAPLPPVILTCSAGYSIEALAPFVASARRHVGDADVVMFCDNTQPPTVDWLLANNVRVLPSSLAMFRRLTGWRRFVRQKGIRVSAGAFRAALRWIARGERRLDERVSAALLDISSSRYGDYLRFLQLYGHRYSSVLVTDCRDVLFQRSPFPAAGLNVFAENENIQTSHFARRWFQLTYGLAIWRELGNRPFLCSGTTVGSVAPMIEYLREMVIQLGAVAAVEGQDQAVHNVVIHRRLVPATIHRFGTGDVVTLNGVAKEQVPLDDGRVVNTDGQPVALVHQYDRVAGLAADLTELHDCTGALAIEPTGRSANAASL